MALHGSTPGYTQSNGVKLLQTIYNSFYLTRKSPKSVSGPRNLVLVHALLFASELCGENNICLGDCVAIDTRLLFVGAHRQHLTKNRYCVC